jgi:hypothetical protein
LFRKTFQEARASLNVSTEARLCNYMLKYTQSLHLASPLFSLDEIVIPPKLMAPPAVKGPEDETLYLDPVLRLIPYTPDLPELAAQRRGPFSLQSLQAGANLLLIGGPGSGKTTAMPPHQPALSERMQPPRIHNLVPIYVHVADIPNKTQVDSGQAIPTAALPHASTSPCRCRT